VGIDREEELAQPVDDLVTPVLDLQLARELRRPERQVLDLGQVGEDLPFGAGRTVVTVSDLITT
jgi:hypothetical protein